MIVFLYVSVVLLELHSRVDEEKLWVEENIIARSGAVWEVMVVDPWVPLVETKSQDIRTQHLKLRF